MKITIEVVTYKRKQKLSDILLNTENMTVTVMKRFMCFGIILFSLNVC